MKIINTIKKYFNNELKHNMSLTSIDNLYDKENNQIYDRIYEDLKLYVDTLVRYNTPQIYDFDDTSDFYCNNLKLCIVGNIAYINGRLYPKADGKQGHYDIPLPLKIFPNVNGILDWSPIIIDGTEYKMHAQVGDPNFDNIDLYLYDAFPVASIPINIVIPLSPTYVTHTD